MSKKPNTKAGSVQALLGMIRFTDNGILTANGEIAVFRLRPTNISVLSAMLIEDRINALTNALKNTPAVEFVCCNAQQNFSSNKIYLQKRASEENTPEIKALLQADDAFLGDIQSNMASTREFLCLIRLRTKEDLLKIPTIEKQLDEFGFAPARLTKNDLKGLITHYMGYHTDSLLPDFDGQV